MLWSNPSWRGGILAAVFAPFKGCNPDVDFLHRGAIVEGWRASLSPRRGAGERRGELVHRLCVQMRARCRRALGASPIRPTLADGRSPPSSISACSVFARLPCRIMDGRELTEGGTYEHPDIRHEEKLRYQEGAALFQGASREVPVHRLEGKGDEQRRARKRGARHRRDRCRDRSKGERCRHGCARTVPRCRPEVRKGAR